MQHELPSSVSPVLILQGDRHESLWVSSSKSVTPDITKMDLVI